MSYKSQFGKIRDAIIGNRFYSIAELSQTSPGKDWKISKTTLYREKKARRLITVNGSSVIKGEFLRQWIDQRMGVRQ